MKFLNSKELKHLRGLLEKCYGAGEKLDYVFMLSENGGIYFASDSIKLAPRAQLHIHSVGIYFGELKNEEVRLSIEGSQAVGPIAGKNVLAVDSRVAKMWMYGMDIPSIALFDGWVIVRCGNDFLGCGRYKEGRILNHVPKERRIHE
jgi:NOL1/NOP2/fmu family ribosome biogenesis protein